MKKKKVKPIIIALIIIGIVLILVLIIQLLYFRPDINKIIDGKAEDDLGSGKLIITVTIEKYEINMGESTNFTIHVINDGNNKVRVVDFWCLPKGPGMYFRIFFPNGTELNLDIDLGPTRPSLNDDNLIVLSPNEEINATFEFSASSFTSSSGIHSIVGVYSVYDSEDITKSHWTGTIPSEAAFFKVKNYF